jgi:hypothetical protein
MALSFKMAKPSRPEPPKYDWLYWAATYCAIAVLLAVGLDMFLVFRAVIRGIQ